MVVYNDFDSLFERFSIMSVDGRLEDKAVLNYLQDKTTKELFEKLLKKVKKY